MKVMLITKHKSEPTIHEDVVWMTWGSNGSLFVQERADADGMCIATDYPAGDVVRVAVEETS